MSAAHVQTHSSLIFLPLLAYFHQRTDFTTHISFNSAQLIDLDDIHFIVLARGVGLI